MSGIYYVNVPFHKPIVLRGEHEQGNALSFSIIGKLHGQTPCKAHFRQNTFAGHYFVNLLKIPEKIMFRGYFSPCVNSLVLILWFVVNFWLTL